MGQDTMALTFLVYSVSVERIDDYYRCKLMGGESQIQPVAGY